MTARSLTLAAVFAMPFGFTGCADADAPPKPEEQPRVEPEKPKTTAELLVGSWEWVKTKDDPTAGIVKERATFTADGRFRFELNDPTSGGEEASVGTYRLDGQTLRFTQLDAPDHRTEKWERDIESISGTELILAWPPKLDGSRHRSKYRRVGHK